MSRRRNHPSVPREWQPMFPAQRVIKPEYEQGLRDMIAAEGGDPDALLRHRRAQDFYANDRYVASVDRDDNGAVVVISFHRRDRKPLRDWRDMQRIKNDIAGDEVEAVELFPAESRLVDTANEYWLWCLPPGERWPFGFKDRTVTDAEMASRVGAVQRERT